MKRTSLFANGMVVLIMLILASCGKTEYKAVPIEEGVDKCPICNMLVADDQYATEIVLKSHKTLKFDDIGDLFVWRTQNGTSDIGEQFVRDYNTKEWIKLSDATYVYDKSIRTPMAYNVISFKNSKDAEAYIQQAGVGIILTSKQVMEHKWEVNEDMMKSMMDKAASSMKEGMDKSMHEGGMDSKGADSTPGHDGTASPSSMK